MYTKIVFPGLLYILFAVSFTGCQKENKEEQQTKVKESSQPATLQGIIAFANVNVIPMSDTSILRNQHVVIQHGKIIAAGPAQRTTIPDQALTIDGRNKYLLPGLTDFHVHFPPNEEDYECTLGLFLSQGITTVVNMEGNQKLLGLRAKVAGGDLPGPWLFTTGPFLNRPVVNTPQEVEQAVVSQKKAGYDFIKLHGELSREAYIALMETAQKEKIRVVGHVPSNLGIETSLQAHQPLIVHAEEYIYSYFSRGRDLPTSAQEIDSMVRSISLATAKAGTWVSPTLTVFNEIIHQVNDINAVLSRPEMAFLPDSVRQAWTPPYNPYVKRWKKEDVLRFSAQYRVMEKLVKGLSEANVPLLVGTDCMVPSVVPGFSIHDEMNLMVLAGLTPFQVIKAATVNSAAFLGNSSHRGTIETGQAADLLLLNANPLENIANLKLRGGVMIRGQWLPESKLQSMIQNCSLTKAK